MHLNKVVSGEATMATSIAVAKALSKLSSSGAAAAVRLAVISDWGRHAHDPAASDGALQGSLAAQLEA